MIGGATLRKNLRVAFFIYGGVIMTKIELKYLIDVAASRRKADLVIKNCQIVNVLNGEIYSGKVAIADEKIIGMGAAEYDGENFCGGNY